MARLSFRCIQTDFLIFSKTSEKKKKVTNILFIVYVLAALQD